MANAERLAAQGHAFYRHGYFEAAEDYWQEALTGHLTSAVEATVHDGLGKVAAQRGRPAEALAAFQQALTVMPPDTSGVTRTAVVMRSALALARLGHRDQALRRADQVVKTDPCSDSIYGVLLINLAALQIDNGVYQLAIHSLEDAACCLGADEWQRYGYALQTNMGLCLLAVDRTRDAQECFLKALTLPRSSDIHAINGLAHLAMLEHRPEDMQVWGERAFAKMWDSLMSFESEELARLTEVLGHMALRLDDGPLAVRFLDHSQTLYGKVGLWSAWGKVNQTVSVAETLPHRGRYSPMADELRRFATLLESMMAQEMLDARAPVLSDIRHVTAQRMAESLGWDTERRQALTYVCRLADLGLSAVGISDINDAATWQVNRTLYERHPELSVRLLEQLALSDAVLAGIQDHHERWDGLGFPQGKSRDEVAPLARIFAVADLYARQTAIARRRHRDVLDEIQGKARTALDPECVGALVDMFNAVE